MPSSSFACRFLLAALCAFACSRDFSEPNAHDAGQPDPVLEQRDARPGTETSNVRDASVDGRDASVDGRDASVDGHDASADGRDASNNDVTSGTESMTAALEAGAMSVVDSTDASAEPSIEVLDASERSVDAGRGADAELDDTGPADARTARRPSDWSHSLDALYEFEQGPLGLGIDASGKGNDLAIAGVPDPSTERVRGEFSAVFYQEAAAQYLHGSSAFEDSAAPTSITLGAWVRTSSLLGDQSLIDNGHEDSGGFGMRIRPDYGSLACFVADSEGSSVFMARDGVAKFSEWTHVACRYDHATRRLQSFVNGVAPGLAEQVSIEVGPGPGELRVGWGFTGQLDEVFFVRGALSDEQIARIWACGVDGRACTCSSADSTRYQSCGSAEDCETAPLAACDSELEL